MTARLFGQAIRPLVAAAFRGGVPQGEELGLPATQLWRRLLTITQFPPVIRDYGTFR